MNAIDIKFVLITIIKFQCQNNEYIVLEKKLDKILFLLFNYTNIYINITKKLRNYF